VHRLSLYQIFIQFCTDLLANRGVRFWPISGSILSLILNTLQVDHK